MRRPSVMTILLILTDAGRERIIAPPMFSVAATWPVIKNLAQYLANR